MFQIVRQGRSRVVLLGAALLATGSVAHADVFNTVTPCRVFDSRFSPPPLAGGVDRFVVVEGVCGIPTDATAISVNVTVVNATAVGEMQIGRGDASLPSSATTRVLFPAGRTRANNGVVQISTDGVGGVLKGIKVRAEMAASESADLIVDVNGYFQGGPVLVPGGGSATFTEGGGPVVVDGGITILDPSSANLVSATVTITNPVNGAAEVLAATSCGGLTVTPGLNSLAITGTQPLATYATCLQSVTYDNGAEDPTSAPRTVTFVVADPIATSNTLSETVDVTPQDDAPVVTATAGTTSFTEDGGPVVVDAGVTVSDVDSASLASATVTITNPQDGASEVLAATSCAGLTVTPGLNSLSITGSQPLATYQTCLQSVTFDDAAQDPDTTTRTVSFVVNDGTSSSAPTAKLVSVAAVNDAPVVTTTAGATAFSEGGGPVVVDAGLTVTDADDPNLASATVTITNPQDGALEVLAATSCAGLTVTPGLNSLSIAGSQPVSTYETCLRSVTFDDTSENPSTTTRVLAFVADDGTASGAPGNKSVTVGAVDDAPVVTTTVGNASFTEDGGPIVVDGGVTVSDVDSANLVSATVTITNPQDGAAEVLAATSCAGLTVTPSLDTLSITGSQPLATYQTCLQSVTYDDTAQDPDTTTRTISFVVNDGTSSSTPATRGVAITALNDAPTVTLSGSAPVFTEDGPAAVLDAALTVADPDSTNLVSATVTITNLLDAGAEFLGTNVGGTSITANYVAPTLTLSGSDTVANYQQVLRQVAYNNTSQNPSTTARSISFTVNDGTVSSNTPLKSLTVQAVNDAPVLTAGGGSATFSAGGAPVVVDPAITALDADSANLVSATVTITDLADAGQETLAANTAGTSITASYVAPTLTLSGADTVANYQQVLRTVTFTDAAPTGSSRSISFQASDGIASSNVVSTTVNFNYPPILTTGGGTTTFTEDGGPVLVEPLMTVTDGDSPMLASATVTITNLLDAGQETLAANTSGTSITAVYAAPTLTLSGSDTVAAYQQVLRSVTYNDASQTPNATARVVRFNASDGALTSANLDRSVAIVAVNDAPVVTTSAGITAFTEDGGAVVVDGALTVTDVDSTNLASATVTITNPQDGAAEVLAATSCAGLTVTPGVNSLSITGSQSLATYQACLRSVTYDNSSQNPGTTTRIVSFVASDGTDSSLPANKSVSVAASDDAPVVTTTAGTTSFTEDGGAVVVDSGITVTDVDSTNLASATVTITNPQDGAAETLAAGACGGLTVTPGVNTLSISGAQSVATYQACLQSVTYDDASQNPGTTPRVVSFLVNDGTSNSNTATKNVSVTAMNDAPVVTTTGGVTSFTEDGGAVVVDSGLTVTDVDNTNLASATVTITNPLDGAVEVLGATACPGLTVTPGVNSLSISGSQTLATYQTCLRSVTYNNSSQNPNATVRVVSFVVNDGALGSTPATKQVSVTPVNDAPSATTNPISYTTPGNTQLEVAGATIAGVARWTDSSSAATKAGPFTDPDGPVAPAIVAASGASTNGGAFSIATDGSFTYVPPVGFSGTDSFVFQVTDTMASTPVTVNVTVGTRVWYVRDVVDTDNPAGGDGRSTNAFDSIAAFNAATTNNGDIIYVFEGNSGTTPYSGTVTLKDGQKLWGQGIALDVPGFGSSLVGAANKARIRTTAANTAVVLVPATAGARSGVEIRGLDLEATGGSIGGGDASNGVDVTASGGNTVDVTISDDNFRGATGECIDLNHGGTGSYSATVHDNTLTCTGNGIDAKLSGTGTLTLTASSNTITASGTGANGIDARTLAGGTGALRLALDSETVDANGNGIVVDGSAAGATTITSFAGNTISGNTGGTGISVTSATFDQTPGGAFQTVAFGNTQVGASGNAVGASGIVLTTASGDISLSNASAFYAAAGAGFRAAGTTPYTGSAGLQITIASGGTAVVEATSGPAVDFSTVKLNPVEFNSIKSTNSPTTGAALNSVLGTFTAGSGSSLTGSTGTGFQVGSSNATITYAGTVNTTAGKGVDLTSNTGSTLSFTGTLTLSSGSNTTFNASGGGTVTATDANNTLASTTGTALNVASTNIGGAGLVFKSIAANGAGKGIVLNSTGTAAGNGGLSVTGSGSTDGSGGTIQNISARGGEFITTKALSLKNMNFTNANTSDGGTCTDLSTSACNAAIYLSGVAGVTLDNVNVTGTTAQQAINGLNVSNFTLSNSTLTSCGTSGTVEEGCIKMRELTGTGSITASDLAFPAQDVVEIVNTAGPALNLTVNNTTFRDSQSSGAGGNGLQVRSQGTASIVVNVTNSSFLRLRTTGVHATAINTASNDVDVTNNTFDPGTGTMIGLDLDADNSGVLVFNVQNNPQVYSRNGPAINVFGDTNATINGRINNNPDVQVKSNVGSNVGSGIRANINKDAVAKIEIKNNVVNVGSDDAGIDLSAIGKVTANPGGATNTLDATVTGNNVTIGATSTYGIVIIDASNAGDTNAVCANVGSNAITRNPSSISSFRARVPSASGFFRMEGFVTNAEATWNAKGNTPTSSGGSEVSFGGSGTFAVCTASLPTNPGPN